MRGGSAGVAAFALLATATLTAPAFAAGERDLVVTIVVEGQKSWRDKGDWEKTTISERYEMRTRLQPIGEPAAFNQWDPDYASRQMAKSAAVQRRVQQAQARTGAAVQAPKTPAEQQALAQKMQKEQQACGQDTACLMQLSQKYAPIFAAMSAQATAAAVPQAQVDEADAHLDEEEPAIFQQYGGYEGCPGSLHIVVDDRTEGAYQDVQGAVPYTITRTADHRGTPIQLRMLCLNAGSTFDLQAKEYWSPGLSMASPHGVAIHVERGNTQRTEEDIPMEGSAFGFAGGLFRRIAEKGTTTKVLPLTKADGSNATARGEFQGQVKVTVTWSFLPV